MGKEMSSGTETQSSLERFINNFFQEKNIRWMLGIGVMILFGSSIMLVTQHWGDMTPFWKCLVVMGYTAIAYGAAEVSYARLGLRMTGTVLKALTLLLIPVSFMSLNWLSSGSGTTVDGSKIGFAALMLLHGIFSAFAARRILIHFLRTEQTTLLISYLALSFAGAIVPAVGSTYPIVTSLILWAMFTAGSVKSARHVFWMTEERQLPRIFGFFPILLLGIQFGLLFGFGCATHLNIDWLGFGCALLAIPVLLTANTVADVFEKQTGGLIRPLPARIILPLVLGTILCPVGLGLAATTLPTAFALVPTAIVAAILMAVIAKRMQSTGFAWAMVACVCIAYKFCPVYFRELAAALRDSAAHSLNEQQLPFAFYGLTCLPLLLTSAVVGRWFKRSGDLLFGKVLPQFAVGASVFLTAIAITNLKAAFLVPAVMAVWFIAIAVYFGDRRILIPAMASVVMASWTAVPFLESVVGFHCGVDAMWISLSTASLLLLVGSRFTDTNWLPVPSGKSRGLVGSILQSPDGSPRPIGKNVSAVVSIAAAVAWSMQNMVANNASMTGWLLLTLALVIQTLVCKSRTLATSSIVFGLVAGVLFAGRNAIPIPQIVDGLNVSAFVYWVLGGILIHRSGRVASCFADPLRKVSTFVLLALLGCWHGPRLVLGSLDFTTPLSLANLLMAAATIVWCFHSASRLKRPTLSIIGTILTLPLISATAYFVTHDISNVRWYPLYWAIGLMATLPLFSVVKALLTTQSERWISFKRNVVEPVHVTAQLLFVGIAVVSLPIISERPVAGLVALLGMFLIERKQTASELYMSAFFANWFGLAWLGHFCIHNVFTAGTINDRVGSTAYAMAGATALSALVFRLPVVNRLHGIAKHSTNHRILLHVATGFSMVMTVGVVGTALPTGLVVLVLMIAAIVITDLMVSAVSKQSESLVWIALLTGAGFAVYLVVFDAISLHFGFMSYGLLSVASLLYLMGRSFNRHERLRIAFGPFTTVANVLPAFTLPLAIGSAVVGKTATWLGGDSQALLFAGAFYFWTGLQSKNRSLLVLATTFMNVALILLWVDLQWSDPQLFMIPIGVSVIGLVQLLQRDIPKSMLNPLRYAGALMILVSPTFHIIGGSWVHLFSLMVVSVVVILAAIGLRLRALVYTGTAFLAADLIAMVCRGSFDNPNLLWLAGLGLGAGVIGVAAFFEGRREQILGRVRVLAATLETWE